MNKADLIQKIAKDSKVSKVAAAKMIDSLVDNVTKSLKKGERVTLVGFGTFSVHRRKARIGRNPQTGEAIKIAARVLPWRRTPRVPAIRRERRANPWRPSKAGLSVIR